MTNDLTRGSPAKQILFFTIPLLIGNLFQQFYSMADTMIVGRTIGVEALAAVGATGSISFLIIGFSQGLTSGFAVITAQRFGAGDMDGVRKKRDVWHPVGSGDYRDPDGGKRTAGTAGAGADADPGGYP